MRIISKLILLFLLACLIFFSVNTYINYTANNQEQQEGQNKEGYVNFTAYRIDNEQLINFSLPKNATQFKIIIYPIINKKKLLDFQEQPYLFEPLEYKVKLKGTDVLNEAVFEAKYNTYTDMQTDELVEPFWLSDQEYVAFSKSMEVDLDKDKNLQLVLSSQGVDAYVVRSYYQQRQSNKRVKQQWLRSSTKRKESLLKYYPFDADTVQTHEINSLYKFSWSSIAPVTKNDKEYTTLKLFEYEARDQLVSSQKNSYSQEYVYLPKGHKYTYRITENAQLSYNFSDATDTTDLEATIAYKKPSGSILYKNYSSSEIGVIAVQEGDYELSFSKDVAFRITPSDYSKVELPESLISSYYLAEGDQISYAIKHMKGFKQGFKAIFHGFNSVGSGTVKFSNYKGETLISEKILNLSFEEGMYMPFTIDSNFELRQISQASEMILKVHPDADRVSISAVDNDLSVSLSNTLEGLSSIMRVSNTLSSDYQNSWFVLKPTEHLAFNRDNKVRRYLNIGRFAIEADRKVAGFEKIKPKNSNRYKVVYYHDQTTVNSGKSALSFKKLSTTRLNNLSFSDKKTGVQRKLRPTLLVHSKKALSSNEVSIKFNGKQLNFTLNNTMQEYALPSTQTKQRHTLQLPKLPNVDFYINYVTVGERHLVKKEYFKAKSYLSYPIYKKGGQFEGVTLHMLSSIDKPHTVKLSLYKNGKLIDQQKTEKSRVYQYESFDKKLSNNIIRTTECGVNCKLYSPQFMPLYEDLSTGMYELRVAPKEIEQTFIDVTKTYYQKGSQTVIYIDEKSD